MLDDISLRARFEIVFGEFALAAVDLLPVILFAFVFPLFIVKIVGLDRKVYQYVAYEVTFFSGLGLLIAYLEYLNRESVIENLLPSLIVAITFFFQLLGRAGVTRGVPMRTRSTLLSGTATVISFLVCSRYFTILFGNNAGL